MPDYTQDQINTLQHYLDAANLALSAGDAGNAMNDINLYYNSQSEMRGYSSDALQVINNISIFGRVANQEIIDAIGQQQWEQMFPTIAVNLASADLQSIIEKGGNAPTENDIADYHFETYIKLNLALPAWGGSSGAALGLDWAVGTLTPKETDDMTSNSFYQTFGEAETLSAINNLERAGFETIGSLGSTYASGDFQSLLNASKYILSVENAFSQKYVDQYAPFDFGSNTVTHQETEVAGANGETLTAELDQDSTSGNTTFSTVVGSSEPSGSTLYQMAGPDARADLAGQYVNVEDGSTATIAGSNNMVASLGSRASIITNGDHNAILAGGNGDLVNTGTGQNDVVFTAAAAGGTDNGTTVVISPGVTTLVGGGPNDKLVFLADRLSSNGGSGKGADVSDTIQLKGGFTPNDPGALYFFNSAASQPQCYATFFQKGSDLFITAGGSDPNSQDPNNAIWNSCILIKNYKPGDFGLNLIVGPDSSAQAAAMASLTASPEAQSSVDDDASVNWGGQLPYHGYMGYPSPWDLSNFPSDSAIAAALASVIFSNAGGPGPGPGDGSGGSGAPLVASVAQFEANRTSLDSTQGGFTVKDTAVHVADALDDLNTDTTLTGISLTDGAAQPLVLKVAQALGDTAALGKITSPYTLTVADSAADVLASLDALNADMALSSVTLSDPGTPTLVMGKAQAQRDGTALGKIAGAYHLVVDPGPTPGTVASTVNYGRSVDLTGLILGAAKVGLPGDQLSIITASTNGLLGSVSLADGKLIYTASGPGLSQPPPNGAQADSFYYIIGDQYGDIASGTASLSITAPVTTIDGPASGSGNIQGTPGDDIITAHGYGNTIASNGGNDTVDAGSGNATVYAGDGNVTVSLAGYGDLVTGGSGNDAVSGSDGSATITLGSGNDTVAVNGYGNTINLGDGANTVNLGAGQGRLTVGNGDNAVTIAGYGNVVTAGNGNDLVTGGDGNETVSAGDGNDVVRLSGYNNQVTVGSGANTIVAGSGNDAVVAGAGQDAVTLAGYNNAVELTGSTATVFGGQGGDVYNMTGGQDMLTTAGWNDHAILNGITSASINDTGHGLLLDIGSSTQTDTIAGFGADGSGLIDFKNQAGGFASSTDVINALQSDGRGGTMLSLGGANSIDFANTSQDQLHAWNFSVG